jgi:hypothetical protein
MRIIKGKKKKQKKKKKKWKKGRQEKEEIRSEEVREGSYGRTGQIERDRINLYIRTG